MNFSAIMRNPGAVFACKTGAQPLKTFITQVMRISFVAAIILFTTVGIMRAMPVKGQNVITDKVAVGLKHDCLEKGIKEIEQQTSFIFYYRKADIDHFTNLTFPIRTRTVEQTLKIMLKNSSLSFKQSDNSIFLRKIDTVLSSEIKGRIVDKESKTPLIGATITVINNNRITFSDSAGNFKCKVPLGRISIKVTYVGYEAAIVSALEITSASETFLNIELRESIKSQLREVKISDRQSTLNSMATVSARVVNTEDANRYAGGYEDPARMVSSFAGVVSVGDRNDIVIRGNSPRGLQWKLDGIEIPSPNHFPDGQGDGGGIFSIISSNILSNSDFYTGAFPAEFGNATAGILDLNMRKGNSSNSLSSFQIGVLGVEASMEGPINKSGASYLVNYRYDNFEALHKLGLLTLDANQKPPVFQDVALKVYLPTKKAGAFTLFGLGGISSTGNVGVRDSLQWGGNYGTNTGGSNNFGNSSLRDDKTENHRMAVLGVEHTLNFPDKATFLKSIFALTYEYDGADDGIILAKRDTMKYPGLNIGSGYLRFSNEKNYFRYPSLKFASILNHKFNARNAIRVGITISHLGFNVNDVEYDLTKTNERKKIVYDTLVNSSGNSIFAEGFIEWKDRITNKFELNAGLHGSFFALNNHSALEPRFGAKWWVSDNSSFSYGFGLHSRIEPLSSYYTIVTQPDGTQTMPNKDLNFTRAIHNVLGYQWSVSDKVTVKLEAYYQYLFDVPIKDSPRSSESILNLQYGLPDTVYSNAGKGYNKGIEFTFEKLYSNNYYILVTSSLYDSKYRAGNGILYNTYYNGNYAFNGLAGKDFNVGATKQNIFGLNFKILLRGGFRYASQYNDNGTITYVPYARQVPYFFSFDTGIKYRQNHQKFSWIVSLDVENVTNHYNILYYTLQQNSNKSLVEVPTNGLGIVPILSFKIQF